jgi:hypothetical protein
MHSPDAHHVIVVGAGASGLSFAIELGRLFMNSSAGKKLNITILEASSIVGGRMRTIRTTCNDEVTPSNFLSLSPSRQECWKNRYEKFQPWPIPLGAEFVHGDENNHTVINRIVRCQQKQQQEELKNVATTTTHVPTKNDWQMDLVVDYSNKCPNLTIFADDQCFHWHDGSSTVQVDDSDNSLWSLYIQKAKECWARLLALKKDDPDMTLKEFVTHEYEELEVQEEQKCVLSILNAVYAITAGTTSNLIGVKETSRQENTWPWGEKNYRLGGCYSEFIDELLMELECINDCPDIEVSIVTKSPVREILVNPEWKSAKVVCYSEQRYECDCICVTIPLAALKRSQLQLTGCGLTDQQRRVIQATNVLSGGKVHALIKWGVDLQKPHSIQIYCDSLRGIFICPHERVFKQMWFRCDEASILITGFCVFTGMDNRERDPIYLEESLKTLTFRILSKSMPANVFRTDSNDNPCLTLSAFDIYDWSNDDYVQGMYSSPSVISGLAADSSPYGHLATPVLNCVYFAGEHTHETGATVQSALESGVRAAQEIYRELQELHGCGYCTFE